MEDDVDWSYLWDQRPALLRIARRHSANAQDAEDVVSEAMLRAAEAADVDVMAAWLRTVTLNLCADAARDRARAPKRVAYARRHQLDEPSPEDVVCDRTEAMTVACRLDGLPSRQRAALRLLAEGFAVGAVADRMGLTYKAVESLLARARKALRDSEGRARGHRHTGCKTEQVTARGGDAMDHTTDQPASPSRLPGASPGALAEDLPDASTRRRLPPGQG